MNGLAHQGSCYSDEDRRRAVVEFSILGSVTKTAESVNIPANTLYDWRKQEWWQIQLAEVREQNKDLIRAKLASIVESGLDAIQDRITNGDAFVDKNNELQRKPASLRDLGTVTGISFDKLRLIDNEPTSITANSKQLEELAEQFKKLANTRVIEGEVSKG